MAFLPNELLGGILDFLEPQDARRFAHASHRLRKIATSHPHFFFDCKVTANRRDGPKKNCTAARIARMKLFAVERVPTSLSLTLHQDDDDDQGADYDSQVEDADSDSEECEQAWGELLSALDHFLHQAVLVRLCIWHAAPTLASQLLDMMDCPMLRIRQFTLFVNSEGGRDEPLSLALPAALFGGNAPYLQDVVLSNIQLPLYGEAIPAMERMRHLRLGSYSLQVLSTFGYRFQHTLVTLTIQLDFRLVGTQAGVLEHQFLISSHPLIALRTLHVRFGSITGNPTDEQLDIIARRLHHLAPNLTLVVLDMPEPGFVSAFRLVFLGPSPLQTRVTFKSGTVTTLNTAIEPGMPVLEVNDLCIDAAAIDIGTLLAPLARYVTHLVLPCALVNTCVPGDGLGAFSELEELHIDLCETLFTSSTDVPDATAWTEWFLTAAEVLNAELPIYEDHELFFFSRPEELPLLKLVLFTADRAQVSVSFAYVPCLAASLYIIPEGAVVTVELRDVRLVG